jgi:uncharacterized membrane protein
VFGLFFRRPYLVTALVAGVAAFFVSGPFIARYITQALIGWDTAIVTFICLTYYFLRDADVPEIKRMLAEQKRGDYLLSAAIVASILSITALIIELHDATKTRGAGLRVALSAGTIVLSWFFMQVVFALRYAREYYLEQETGVSNGGLEFGPAGEPDYRDFLHFSLVLGATSQTADICFTSKPMRRIGTLHTLVAFGFNTAILATMINVAGSLF